MNLKRCGTLFRKDFKNYLQNKNALFMILLPPFFALLYSMLFSGDEGAIPPRYFFTMTVSMSLCGLPIAMLSMSIAEEREKHTLRTLMLSGVTAMEFLFSKALACLLLLTAADTAIFLIVGVSLSAYPAFLFATTLAGLCLECVGGVIGLAARNQISTGTLSGPLMLAFMLPTLFANVNEFVAAIARFTPVYAALQLFSLQTRHALFAAQGLWYLGVLLAWTLLFLGTFWLVYKKRGVDN